MITRKRGRPARWVLGGTTPALPLPDGLTIDSRGRLTVPGYVRAQIPWLHTSDTPIELLVELFSGGEAELRPWETEGTELEQQISAGNLTPDEMLMLRSRFQRLQIDKQGRISLSALLCQHLLYGTDDRSVVGIFDEQSAMLVPTTTWWQQNLDRMRGD